MANSVTFPEALGGNGQTYTDDADPDTGLDGLGYTVRFIPCLQQAVAMGLSAQSNAEAAAGYVQQCQTLREEVGTDRQAVADDRTHVNQQKGLVDDAAEQVGIDKQAVADDRTHVDQQKGLVDDAAEQVGIDKQAVTDDRTHVDQQKGLVDDAAEQVAIDKQAVADDRLASQQAAGESSDAAVASIQARDEAEALYGDLNAVETAKTQAQQAATDAGEERGLAETARTGAETAQEASEQAASTSQQAADAAVSEHVAEEDPHAQYEKKATLRAAAYRDVTESRIDSTEGRLLKVGDVRVGLSSVVVGVSYKGLPIANTPSGGSWFLPLGLSNDPNFRIRGTFVGGRSPSFNTGERWASLQIDHANRASGGEPNTQWILRQQGFGARLVVESRIWQGQRWLGITQPETDQNVWQTTLVFDGFISNIPDAWVSLADTSDVQPTYTYGPNTWQFQGGAVLHGENTTVDSNGFVKSASPILRLANNPESAEGDGFVHAGAGTANREAQGVAATHDAVGVYTVSGSLGFAVNGWTVEVPQDSNGNRLCVVETEQADDGTITVRTFSKTVDAATGDVVPDAPIDIPAGRWVDLRLRMPPPPTSDHPDDVPESPLPLTPEQEEQARIAQLERWRSTASITPRQARLVLAKHGLLTGVADAIAAIEDPVQRQIAEIEWEYATLIERAAPWVNVLYMALGLTQEDVDSLFREAALL